MGQLITLQTRKIIRKRFTELRSLAVLLQTSIRGTEARVRYNRMRRSAIVIQSQWRGFQQRTKYPANNITRPRVLLTSHSCQSFIVFIVFIVFILFIVFIVFIIFLSSLSSLTLLYVSTTCRGSHCFAVEGAVLLHEEFLRSIAHRRGPVADVTSPHS